MRWASGTSITENPIVRSVQAAISTPGITPDGAAWLSKALHPADSTLTVNGIPTMEAIPTASLNFMTTVNVAAPAAATWKADVMLNPTPLYFGKIIAQTAAAYSTTTAYNTTLGVSSFNEFGGNAITWHEAAMKAWSNNVEAYRMTYACVTATLSASATANEGVVTTAQFALPSLNHGSVALLSLADNPVTLRIADCRWYDYNRRTQAQLQATAGATTWEARKGVYSILKLDREFNKWKESRDTCFCLAYNGLPDAAATVPVVEGANVFDAHAAVAASAKDVPFGPQGIWCQSTAANTGAASANTLDGSRQHLPPHNISQLSFVGLDANASLSLTFRVGFEAIVQPESIYAGQVGAPMEYDVVALRNYFTVSRQMLAAYPAEYNILGAIFQGIKKFAMPAFKAVGGSILRTLTGNDAPVSPPMVVSNPIRQPQVQYVDRPPRQLSIQRRPRGGQRDGERRQGRRRNRRQ